jgi:hypothetical protein
MSAYEGMSREQLLVALRMFAKMWLAHDGCWFLAAEEHLGLNVAMELDRVAWQHFAEIEATRIRETFDIPPRAGLEGLVQALNLRMYSLINTQHMQRSPEGALRFRMDVCRVQETRRRKGLPDFPCRPIGEVEFSSFARAIDPRLRTRCVQCPPDSVPGEYCEWEFVLE